MAQIQYQAKAEPLLTSWAEQVTESRWHQPWSEPKRWLMAPAMAVVLATASGNSFNPLPIPNSNPAIIQSTWYAPFSEPVRVKPRLIEANQRADFLTEAAPFGETITESRWHQPWSEPVRFPPQLRTAAQLAFASPPDVEINVIAPTAWYNPFTDPVRVPLRLGPGLNQFQPENPWGPTQPETIFESEWHFPWSEPVRIKPGLRPGYAPTLTIHLGPLAETVMESKWHQPWSEPKRYPPILGPGLNPFLALTEAAPFQETIFESKFHFPWSEPVRIKPGLYAPYHPAQFRGDIPRAETVLESKFHFPWSEPVRLKPGLLVTQQVYQDYLVIVPPLPTQLLRNVIVRARILTSNPTVTS